jgi:hypothetical protein
MATTIRLVEMSEETNFAPLGVLGYCLTRTAFLAPVWAELNLPMKTVRHSPHEKLMDVLVSILGGCRSVQHVNTRLRPDLALAAAWGRRQFAEQSVLARTLDRFRPEQLAQLRRGSEVLFRRESRMLRHDFARDWLWLDIDLTPLPISKHAEDSTKGKFNARNRYGRQLARVHAPQYHETLFSRVYPGNQESSPVYMPTLKALDAFLDLPEEHKRRTIVRSDAGFGSDANVNRALDAGWQVLTKNKGGRRPTAFARKIAEKDWVACSAERWLSPAVSPPSYTRPMTCLVMRFLTSRREIKYAILLCSVTQWTMQEVLAYYDDRGACETEIQADKGGLKLERRRKKRATAQEVLVLLTDLGHNLLAWVRPWMFPTAPLASFGTMRMIEDVFHMPGRLCFCGERLTEVQLNRRHPYAAEVADGLKRLLEHFGYP